LQLSDIPVFSQVVTLLMNSSYSLSRYPFRGIGVYLILGKVVEEFDFPSIEVEKMAKLEMVSDPRY